MRAQVDIVKRNTNLKNVQDNFFFFKTSVGGTFWQSCTLSVGLSYSVFFLEPGVEHTNSYQR